MKKFLNRFILLSTFIFITAILGICSSAPKERTISKSAIYFDTPITLTIYYENDNVPSDSIFQEVFDKCSYYQNICDRHSESSELSKLNSRSLKCTIIDGIIMYSVSKDLYAMIKAGYDAHHNYSNQFDITVAPLIDLWNFKAQYSQADTAIPSPDSINDILKLVDTDFLILKETPDAYLVGFAENNNSIQIDLGGLAKGYIADEIKNILTVNKVDNALIDLGGNIYAMGSHIDGSEFVIGIKKPFTTSGELIHSVNVSDKSVVTSGIYERYFEHENEMYHHVLSPTTGYPSRGDLLSVTIIADSSLDCDILSTTCLLIGKDLATKLVEGLDNVNAVFVTTDYDVITVD